MEMIEVRKAAERSFWLSLWLAIVVVVVCVATLTFLRSDRGRRSLVVDSSVTSLLLPDSISGRGGVVLEGGREGGGVLPLTTVELDSKSTYLLIARLSAGGPVAFVGIGGGTREVIRCPSRPVPLDCQRLLDARALPEELRFHAFYRGRKDVRLRRVTIARLSPSYFWLRTALHIILWLAPVGFLLRHRHRWIGGLLEPRPADDVTFALMLFGLCLLVFHSAPVRQVMDSRFLTAVSYSLMHGDGIGLQEPLRTVQVDRRYQINRVGGKLLHHYSPVPAILDVPVVAVYEWFGVTPAVPGGGWSRRSETRILRMSAALVSALLCVVLYATARLHLKPPAALGLALVFAFGTQILSTLSRPYWSQTWGALLAAAAIFLILRPRKQREIVTAALAATLISLAFYCRPQIVWTVVGLVAVLAVSRSWRRLATFVAVGSLWAFCGVLMSLEIYDSLLPSYFFASQVAQGRLDAGSLDSYRYLTGSLGALVSPGRGLFIYSPIYLWILYQVVTGWRSLSSRTWATVALGVIAGHLWLLVHTGVWPGGHSYGARQFSDVLVWFFLLAVLAVEALQDRWKTLASRTRRVQVAALFVLVVFSLFVNFRGAWSNATWMWRSYDRPPSWMIEGGKPLLPQPELWNWRHPQFLAGLLPLDASAVPVADEVPEE